MKKGKIRLLIIIFILLSVGLVYEVMADEKEYGVLSEAEDIVPSYEILMQNLTKEGYSIEEEMQALNCDVKAKRVIATKGNKYIDICYELNDEDVDLVFEKYREKYEDTSFYILAQNGKFVYCVSDKKTFKKSGFTSTANVGYQIMG